MNHYTSLLLFHNISLKHEYSDCFKTKTLVKARDSTGIIIINLKIIHEWISISFYWQIPYYPVAALSFSASQQDNTHRFQYVELLSLILYINRHLHINICELQVKQKSQVDNLVTERGSVSKINFC